MASSTIPFTQAEEVLSSASLMGIVPEDQPWTLQVLSDLYIAVRNSTPSTFPPPNFRTTARYVPVTYVQSEGNPPFIWAQTVYAILSQLHSDTGKQYGIWFDKMGSRQFPALQTFWGPLANVHYAVRPVVHVTPAFRHHDEQLREKPVCGLSAPAYLLLCDWLRHHQTCDSCLASFRAGMGDLGFEQVALPPGDWAHPGAYFRAWPMVERALATYNCGLLTTAHGLHAIVSACVALLGLVKLCDGLRGTSQHASEYGFRVLNHHTLNATYDCEDAEHIGREFFAAFEDTIRMMADRLAVDATKMEPVGADDKFSVARRMRGWTAGSAAQMQPIFARNLWQRAGIEHGDSIDFAIAKREILSGWAGRAPCYAAGDKVAAVALLSNFVLVSRLVREKGAEWLKCFVNVLYDRGWGVANEDPDIGAHLDAFENYSVFPASIGLNGRDQEGQKNRGALFGRYSGCIPINAFWDFLKQSGHDSAAREKCWAVEQSLWKNSVEFDGEVFRYSKGFLHMDTQSLQPRLENCPKCAADNFKRVGTIWRSTRGKMGKRRFWAVGEGDAQQAESVEKRTVDRARALIAAGEVRVDPRFGSRCRACGVIAEAKVFRGWPLGCGQAWVGVLVVDLKRRPPPSASRLSGLRAI